MKLTIKYNETSEIYMNVFVFFYNLRCLIFTNSYLMWSQVQAVNCKELNRKGLFNNIFNFIPQSLCIGSKVRYDFEPRFCRSFCLLPQKSFFLGSVASCRVPSAICRVAAAAAAGERGEDFSLSRWQFQWVRFSAPLAADQSAPDWAAWISDPDSRIHDSELDVQILWFLGSLEWGKFCWTS